MFEQFQYKHVTLNGDDVFLTHTLTELAVDGWRVHTFTRTGDNIYVLLEKLV